MYRTQLIGLAWVWFGRGGGLGGGYIFIIGETPTLTLEKQIQRLRS